MGYSYSSTVDPWAHRTLGMAGFLVVVRKGELGADMLPNDVDVLIPLLWQVGESGKGGTSSCHCSGRWGYSHIRICLLVYSEESALACCEQGLMMDGRRTERCS